MKGCLSRRTGGRESFAGRTAIRQHCPFPPSRSPALPHCNDCRRPPLDVGVLARPGNGAATAVPPLSFAARARSRSIIVAVVACGRRCFVGRADGTTDGEFSRCWGKRRNVARKVPKAGSAFGEATSIGAVFFAPE